MRKVKVIIKRPDEPVGHVTHVSDSLKNLQQIVDGRLEAVTLDPAGLIMLCNDEGKLRGLPLNFCTKYDSIVGTVILCGADGENFGDVPINLKTWKTLLSTWGNRV